MKVVQIKSDFGVQVFSPNIFVQYPKIEVPKSRWHIKFKKWKKPLSFYWLIWPLIVIWAAFGLDYAFTVHYNTSMLVLILFIYCAIIGFCGSYIFGSRC